VAAIAQRSARPCLVLAGRVDVGRREAAAVGVEAAYDLVSRAGSVDAATAEPARWLALTAAHAAHEWSR
jgi:glycerate kinase